MSKLLVEPSSKANFLTFEVRLAFAKLRQVFIKAPIFYYFDPEWHIQFETDIFGYAIGRVLGQLILNDLGQ